MQLDDVSSECVLWLEVAESIVGEKLLIGVVYIPHEGSDYHSDDIYGSIAKDIVNFNSTLDIPILLMADLILEQVVYKISYHTVIKP